MVRSEIKRRVTFLVEFLSLPSESDRKINQMRWEFVSHLCFKRKCSERYMLDYSCIRNQWKPMITMCYWLPYVSSIFRYTIFRFCVINECDLYFFIPDLNVFYSDPYEISICSRLFQTLSQFVPECSDFRGIPFQRRSTASRLVRHCFTTATSSHSTGWTDCRRWPSVTSQVRHFSAFAVLNVKCLVKIIISIIQIPIVAYRMCSPLIQQSMNVYSFVNR